ncbi:hypothetical protein D3C73_1414680 [compost metagenome]
MLIVIISGINYVKNANNKKYAVYSIITFVIMFVSGLTNAVLAGNGMGSFFGVTERITIGSFMVWLVITGIEHCRGKLLK